MKRKIFHSILTVAMTVLLSSLVMATSFVHYYFNASQIRQLKDELSLVASYVNKVGTDYFQDIRPFIFRFTVVASDGTVLYDTQAPPSEMENHLNREEIQQALATGKGSSARYSSTLTEKTLYQAVLLKNGSVLRVSVSQLTVGALLLSMLPAIAAAALIAMIGSLILSDRMAKRIVQPLNALNLESPMENNAYEELAPILTKINRQQKQITEQMNLLQQKTEEFDQITTSMNEGLILLDQKGQILSINPSAKKQFEMTDTPIGRDFLTVDRSPKMSHAISAAFVGKHSEFRQQKQASEYQFSISPIETDGKIVGAVILCFDVTEIAFAERNRREFTANVSHELKTPLQSIIGSAELLENGLVKPEDTQRFIGNIRNEATRLVALINDIIRLSQIDDNAEPVTVPVDLYEVAHEVIESLMAFAQEKKITLHLIGTPCVIQGIRQYLYEIIYNLCDNAIRYNQQGGSVTVHLTAHQKNTIVTVSDTGIGISPEHQNRIFERFYRVDKSHARETGGTGLGLSIVKHAVAHHGGTISLDSTVGKGTTITITF